MLKRKIERIIEKNLINYDQILMIEGARQIGKSFIIRYIGQKNYKNFLEINLEDDFLDEQVFLKIRNKERLYLELNERAIKQGIELDSSSNTLVFLDEIQRYPHLISMLKALKSDNKYKFIASGSLLGVALSETTFIPGGSTIKVRMYPLDFEEFLYANGMTSDNIENIKNSYLNLEPLDEYYHDKLMNHFKDYLLVGGLPAAVNAFIKSRNIIEVRKIQAEIYNVYLQDAIKYEEKKKLKIQKIYKLIPSSMESKKKRIRINEIENKKGARSSEFQDEFEYLLASGISLGVNAIANPKFPLIESETKNLIKLYYNDVGILTGILYHNNSSAIYNDLKSINLGAVYETVVAQELSAHNNELFYYDNRKKGEVDFIINNYIDLSALPIEVKSGKDYTRHIALNNLLNCEDYNINKGIVLSNNRNVNFKNRILYLPVYYVMFLSFEGNENDDKKSKRITEESLDKLINKINKEKENLKNNNIMYDNINDLIDSLK